MSLNIFFNPHSIAVIGASSDKNKVGFAIISNLVSGGDTSRKIYPVTISEKEVLGLKTYSSVKDIEDNVDLALIAVRADIVPLILEDCAEKKIRSVVIISAGFREVGPPGAELEKKIADIAKKNGITLLGPNCLGVIDTHTSLNASFAASMPKKGHIAFLSQSGALGTAVLDKALAEGVGFSKFISLGNEAIISEIEVLEYLRDDNDTKAILMYVEQLRDGREFMKLAAEITEIKPIALIKAGRSIRGQQAVMSHTGSLSPEDAVFTAACRQSGIIVVESIREFFNMAKLFELRIFKPLQKLIVLTNAGGPAVVTADLIDLSKSLSLVDLKIETKEALRNILPTMAAVNNPVDIIGDALSARYDSALKILVEEKEADAIIVLLTPQMMTEVEATAKLLAEYGKKKPIIPVFIGGRSIEKGLVELRNGGLVNFTFPKDAVEALDSMANCTREGTSSSPRRNVFVSLLPRFARDTRKSTFVAGSTVVPSRDKPSSTMMPFNEMHALFEKYGLELPGTLVKEKTKLIGAISRLGAGPYAMKIISPDIIHKTDAGAVKLNIKSIEEANAAWDLMEKKILKENPSAIIEGFLVQKMGIGREVIIGMKRDAKFGPTILFGFGGILAEAIKDTSLRIAPVSKDGALRMTREIKGANILNGTRGGKPVDFDALADIIVNISRLAVEHSEIKEIDLNPVMANSDGAVIVDARVII